jgi:hypothetical protein
MERYLRYEQPVGEHLKYLAFAQGRPIACLAWSSAPRHLGSRDRFIAYNTRFLILPWVGVPHLASPILGKGGSPPGEAKTTGPTGPTARLRKSSACRWRPVSASSSASYENDISDGCECTGRANRMERSSKRCCRRRPILSRPRRSPRRRENASRREVPHKTLHPGDRCPECSVGKVYRQKERCGEVFTADKPAEARAICTKFTGLRSSSLLN